MRRAGRWAVLFLLLFLPAVAHAEWKLLESKYHENAYGTKYFYDPRLTYDAVSSDKNPVVVLWGRVVFLGKTDPDYVRLLQSGCPPEATTVDLKYLVDVRGKRTAIVYGVLRDAQDRVLGSNEEKKTAYHPIPPATGAEYVWNMIRELHEKGAISR